MLEDVWLGSAAIFDHNILINRKAVLKLVYRINDAKRHHTEVNKAALN
jgi:hypothetical protein